MTLAFQPSILKQASRNKSALQVLSDPKYYTPKSSAEFRTAHAKKILDELRVNATAITDDPSKSKTRGPGADLGNQPIQDQDYPQSVYQTPDEMRRALKATGLNDKSIEMAVEAAFGTTNSDAKQAKILLSQRNNLQMKLVNKGFPTSSALKIANDTFGITADKEGSIITETKNHGLGGGKSTVTTKIPPTGVIKQSSVETPSYIVLAGLEEEFKSMVQEQSPVKSASLPPAHYFPERISDILYRKRELEPTLRAEIDKEKKLKQASTEYPSWYVIAKDGNV